MLATQPAALDSSPSTSKDSTLRACAPKRVLADSAFTSRLRPSPSDRASIHKAFQSPRQNFRSRAAITPSMLPLDLPCLLLCSPAGCAKRSRSKKNNNFKDLAPSMVPTALATCRTASLASATATAMLEGTLPIVSTNSLMSLSYSTLSHQSMLHKRPSSQPSSKS